MGTRTRSAPVAMAPGPVVAADLTVEVTTKATLPDRLWRSPVRAATFGSTLAGVVLVALGWVGVSGTRVVSHQLPWLVTSIAGLGLAALGQGVWVLSGRRTLGQGFVAVLPAPSRRAGADVQAADAPSERRDDGALVAVDGRVGLYHRLACP